MATWSIGGRPFSTSTIGDACSTRQHCTEDATCKRGRRSACSKPFYVHMQGCSIFINTYVACRRKAKGLHASN
jgi:hypothetical protein